MSDQSLDGSFRDPAGFMFRDNKGRLLRQVNPEGADDYRKFMDSKLYDDLVSAGHIVSHKEVALEKGSKAYAVLAPDEIPFITYPFEWSFSQLQDAALLTLSIQKAALKRSMTLKDASAYNIQFTGGKPIFIDTLSFEEYKDGMAWTAYKQFCQHFLAPLALMAKVDPNLGQLLRVHLDGIPLPLAAKLMPGGSKWNAGLAMHLFLHARAQKAKEGAHQKQSGGIQKQQLQAIIDSLIRTVRKLRPGDFQSEWGDYYANNTNYSVDAADAKAKIVSKLAEDCKAKTAIDIGGNNGRYSRVLNKLGIFTVCSDIDPNAVEANYRFANAHKERLMLPLLVDMTNPGGGLGWGNVERPIVSNRIHADLVMALAVIHHLAISNNLPMAKIAEYFAQFAPNLILEFVPKQDSQVQKLLATREDIFPDYTEQGCKDAFAKYYTLQKEEKVKGSKRTVYLFKRKG